MSRMSEQHDELSTIHAILLGQRKIAVENHSLATKYGGYVANNTYKQRAETIDNLLLEIEAAGVVWPDNVVETASWGQEVTKCLDDYMATTKQCDCSEWHSQGKCSKCKGDFSKCWPKEF